MLEQLPVRKRLDGAERCMCVNRKTPVEEGLLALLAVAVAVVQRSSRHCCGGDEILQWDFCFWHGHL